MRLARVFLPLAALLLGSTAMAQAASGIDAALGPVRGPLHIIGAGTGCIVGAQQLPHVGLGYTVIRAPISSFWGAPVTLFGVETLAAEARADGLPELYVGDLSGPRGGPLSGGHVAHQRGVDVDIYLDTQPKPNLPASALNRLAPPLIVPYGATQVDPAQWSSQTVTLIHLATQLPGLNRLLVNPVIKRQLCDSVTGDRSWLHKVRPWWGHRGHMHLHFACPAGQTDCVDQAPIPAGDGCDASLAWWFNADGSVRVPPPSAPGAQPPTLPVACDAILGPGGSALPAGAEAD
ncbi:penicillin-insensitive murein endopeptidase [Acidisoma cellulosilytica]|uniref:Penicillin-insensitive murein endopeptidase n=1 Tax=Acidisoma cellulosilyticum TaxID=2802395 RepID=A0A963Z0F7_9PROT|nr:penicillin-insensitive murein endopeptidase [Acidisoma cellulosilyticum]MCB8879563.1 penicillin-insensitive murein endopeptidase [Acidisoma cellulosilyticum]